MSNFGIAFCDSVLDSLVVQQARRDANNGQSDMVILRMLSFGIGATTGGIAGAFFMHYFTELYSILFGALISFLALLSAMFIPDSLETNQYAIDPDNTALLDPSFCDILRAKFEVIKDNLSEPLNKKFYLFLITQGLIMPSFTDFEYFFAVDVLKITTMAINLSTIFGAIFLFLLPVLYQKYLAKKEYLISFYFSQVVYIIAICLTLCLAFKINKHIPDIILFAICGPLA